MSDTKLSQMPMFSSSRLYRNDDPIMTNVEQKCSVQFIGSWLRPSIQLVAVYSPVQVYSRALSRSDHSLKVSASKKFLK